MNIQTKNWDIIFSTLTRIEVDFFTPFAERLIDKGYKVGFILFDESACNPLKNLGIPSFNMQELSRRHPLKRMGYKECNAFVDSFNIDNIRNLYMHERLGYNRKDEQALLSKTVLYLQILDNLFAENNIRCLIQEVGGFAAYNTVYYASRKHNIDHVFYEPSPIPKHVVFNMNNYLSDIPPSIMEAPVSEKSRQWALDYINNYNHEKSVVVPAKDRHSFRDMKIGRMFNRMNALRLSSKLYRKYFTGESEEFNEIGYVIKFNLSKIIRRAILARYYTLDQFYDVNERYVYFPLHVPHDVQLSVRSKQFYAQEAFVEYLSRVLPYGYKLYIKEHPASIGAHSLVLIQRLLKNNKNVRLIHPSVNSFDIIRQAELVVTVNSKVGFEAIMQNKGVIVVGKTFYRNKGLTFDVGNLEDLEGVVTKALKAPPLDSEKVLEFIARTYEWSYPCELFDTGRENYINAFNSFVSYLESKGLLDVPRDLYEKV